MKTNSSTLLEAPSFNHRLTQVWSLGHILQLIFLLSLLPVATGRAAAAPVILQQPQSQVATLPFVPPVIAYEGFDYEPGTNFSGQNGGIGFSNAWSRPYSEYPNPYVLASNRLLFPVPAAGNSVRCGGSQEDSVVRALASPLGVAGTPAGIRL